MILWLLPLTALANRYRGAGNSVIGPQWAGDQVRRGLTAVVVALVALPDWRAALALLLLWPGLMPGWARYQDMGSSGGTKLTDLIGMTLRGLVLTGPAGLLLWYLGYAPWFALAGALMGPIYLGCSLVNSRGWGPRGLHGYTDWAELFVGLWLGVAVVLFV